MKFLFFFILAFSISAAAHAGTGFHCSKLKVSVSRELTDGGMTLVIRHADGTKEINERLVLSSGNETSDYQSRMGIYAHLSELAIMNFPWRPEIIHIFHAVRGGKLYRDGFAAFEGNGEPVKLKNFYCKPFLKSLRDF